jgi:hypothetical protein
LFAHNLNNVFTHNFFFLRSLHPVLHVNKYMLHKGLRNTFANSLGNLLYLLIRLNIRLSFLISDFLSH